MEKNYFLFLKIPYEKNYNQDPINKYNFRIWKIFKIRTIAKFLLNYYFLFVIV